jgi:hypothetical protein
MRRSLPWIQLLLALVLFIGLSSLPMSPRRSPLAPIASLYATIQWARADAAFDEGRLAVGLARAERALELNPTATEGWSWLASVLVHRFGAPEFEASTAARRAWTEAGLAVLARGEPTAAEPEELAFHAGLVMAFVASLPDEVLEWPGGAESAWTAAAEHFERAKALGHPRADDTAQAAWREVHRPAPKPGDPLPAPPFQPHGAPAVPEAADTADAADRALPTPSDED